MNNGLVFTKTFKTNSLIIPVWIYFKTGSLVIYQRPDQRFEQTLQVACAIDLKAVSHDLGAQRVPAEQSLHTVRDFYLAIEHVPQQGRQQVLRIEQCDKHTSQLIL